MLLWVAPPVLAFLVAQLVMYAAALHAGYGSRYFDASSWARGDSVQYLSIANHGYSIFRCTGNSYPPHSWCGNDAWLPLYPGLMELVATFGLSHLQGGADISAVMTLALFGLLWQLIGPSWAIKPLLALALAAVFPGQVYFFVVFPISLALVSSLSFLLFLSRRQYGWAGLAGATGVWAYSGILLAPVALVFTLFFDQAKSMGERVSRSVRTAGAVVAGFLLMLVGFQIWVGKWNALFLVGSKYGHTLNNPITEVRTWLVGHASGRYAVSEVNASLGYPAVRAQTYFVFALLLLLLIGVYKWRASLSSLEKLAAIYTAAVFLFMLIQSVSSSVYRTEALLLPAVILVRRLPIAIQVVLCGGAAYIAYQMGVLWFANQLA